MSRHFITDFLISLLSADFHKQYDHELQQYSSRNKSSIHPSSESVDFWWIKINIDEAMDVCFIYSALGNIVNTAQTPGEWWTKIKKVFFKNRIGNDILTVKLHWQ